MGTRANVHATAWGAHARWLLGEDDAAVRAAGDAVGLARTIGDPFNLAIALAYSTVTHQLRRVMQVFVPTLLFCVFMQWLGLYVASFVLITGFMWIVGRIALWKSLAAGFLFSIIMFITFDIAFDVIMPKGPLEAALGY